MKTKMKLWMLERRVDLAPGNDPWKPWYDKTFSMVVQAETESEARAIAQDHSGDESHALDSVPDPWQDPAYSTCVELKPEDKAGLVIQNYHHA